MITVRDLSKVYRTPDGVVEAVSGVSFSARPGEFIAIVGPSGCGKSTLLMMIAGLRQRTSGDLYVDGQPVVGPPEGIGVVFQVDVLLDWRTVLDNVLLQIECRRLRKSDYRSDALRLLRSVGLAGFERSRPYELSGGMRQRVSICRALIHDPNLLLMDEPFASLDAMTREQMGLDLQALWLERNKTVLFITHSIPEAVFLADRVLVMSPRPGRIELDLVVDLPRPRHLSVFGSTEFNAYVATIRQSLEAYGVLRER